MTRDSTSPTKDALLKSMEIQWLDHFQTRSQTWKALQITAILAVALVGLDWRIDNPAATIGIAILLLLIAIFGIQITLRHRAVERTKFRIMANIEEQLGIKDAEVTSLVEVHWWDAFLFWKSSTSLFILRIHFAIALFALGYMILTCLTR